MRLVDEILGDSLIYGGAAYIKRVYEHDGRTFSVSCCYVPCKFSLAKVRRVLRHQAYDYLSHAKTGDVITGIEIPSGDDE